MADLVEETVTITLSQLVKKGGLPPKLVNDELLTTLETVAQELVGKGVIVEVK